MWPLVLLGVAATTIVATLATGPIAAHHFNRVAAFGLIANLVAVPLAGFVVMPLGLLSLVLMPFGLDGLALDFMASAIGYFIETATRVSALEGAVWLVPSTPGVSLALFAAGGLWICLWRSRWRLLGLAPIAVSAFVANAASTPDLIIARDGRNVALRGSDGALSVALVRVEGYSVEQWLRRDGDRRSHAQAVPGGFSCDFAACVGQAWNGQAVAYVIRRDALEEECARSDILITPLVVGRSCRADLVIDLLDVRKGGPHAVFLAGNGSIATVETSRQLRGDRPLEPGRTMRGRSTRPNSCHLPPRNDAECRADKKSGQSALNSCA